MTTVSLSGSSARPMDEWAIFQGAHPHALLIASRASADAAIERLRPFLRAPLVPWHPRSSAEPPDGTGTLVIWDVDGLDRSQQKRLLLWLDDHADAQVMSVAERSVFPLVLAGAFLDTLYYRLNMVCVTSSSRLGAASKLSLR